MGRTEQMGRRNLRLGLERHTEFSQRADDPAGGRGRLGVEYAGDPDQPATRGPVGGPPELREDPGAVAVQPPSLDFLRSSRIQ